jgi:hypothetical protein
MYDLNLNRNHSEQKKPEKNQFLDNLKNSLNKCINITNDHQKKESFTLAVLFSGFKLTFFSVVIGGCNSVNVNCF